MMEKDPEMKVTEPKKSDMKDSGMKDPDMMKKTIQCHPGQNPVIWRLKKG